MEKCVELAIAIRDESLVENLVWTLGAKVASHEELLAVAKGMPESRLVSRALSQILGDGTTD